MADEQGFIDDVVETQGAGDSGAVDTAVADAGADGAAQADDNYGALQDRMAGDVEDSPWYSPSEG